MSSIAIVQRLLLLSLPTSPLQEFRKLSFSRVLIELALLVEEFMDFSLSYFMPSCKSHANVQMLSFIPLLVIQCARWTKLPLQFNFGAVLAPG